MQIEPSSPSTKNQSIMIPDLEEFEFKAIGEGLGFHQKEEKPRWSKPATTSSSRMNSIASTSKVNLTPSNSISREQLGFLYNPESQTASLKANEQSKKSKAASRIKLAGLPERFTAQMIDTIIITLTVSFMVTSMLAIAGVPLKQAMGLLTSFDIAPVVAILWSFAYISYFTILETKQTPGKSIMRIAVVDMNDRQLSLAKSLERTVFRSLSWLALGFPLLMNFHGRLSGSKVIKQ